MEITAPQHGVEQFHPGPPGQVVVAGTGLRPRGRLAGLAQAADRRCRADQAERLDGGRHLVARLDSDWARLTEPDFSEASSRLRRLARTYLLTYEMAGEQAWDAPRDPAWTLREIAEHVSGVSAYAEFVGNLR